MDETCCLDKEDKKKCVQNADGVTSWKADYEIVG